MGNVLSSVNFTPPAPSPPPTAVQAAAAAIAAVAPTLFQQLVTQRIAAYDRFWNNPGIGCDPISLAAQLGNQAVSIFECDQALVGFLASIVAAANAAGATPPIVLPSAATAGVPAGWTFTPNADGTATIERA